MPYSSVVIDKKDYLFFVIGGEVDALEDVIAHTDSIISQALKSQRNRLLLDETQLVMNIDGHDAILLAEHLANTHLPSRGMRAAVVCAPQNQNLIRSFETALQNRSINYKMFMDVEAAEKWLLS